MGKWIETADKPLNCARCTTRVEAGERFWYQSRGKYYCELCGSIAEHEVPEVGEIEAGVLADLDQMPDEAGERVIAKMMIATARRIDNGDVADRDLASLLKEIRQMLTQLQLDFPPEPEDDDTEKTRKKREKRLLMDGDLRDY